MPTRSGYRGYISSRPVLGSRVPQHVQNLVIRDYAGRRGLSYKLSGTEYVMPGCYMMLEQLLAELTSLEGIICYTMFMLPRNRARRGAVFERLIERGGVLHAAVEMVSISTRRDIDRVEDIFMVQTAMSRPTVGA